MSDMQGRRARRGKLKEPVLHTNGTGDGDQNGYQYLYEYVPDRLRQTTVEVHIRRAYTARVLKDWRGMCVAATKADEDAKILEYEPLNARCRFYKGISLYYLRDYWAALEDLTFARACIGIYKEENEVEAWISKARIATSSGARRFSYESRTPDTRTAPVTPASTVDEVAQALADDLDSALRSGRWSSISGPTDASDGESRRASRDPSYRQPYDDDQDSSPIEGHPSTTQYISLRHPGIRIPSIGPVPEARKRHPRPPFPQETDSAVMYPTRKRSIKFAEPPAIPGRRASLRERTLERAAAARRRAETAASRPGSQERKSSPGGTMELQSELDRGKYRGREDSGSLRV